jgi:hypothetical protein
MVVQGGANYKKLRRQQFASQLRFFRQLCTAAKVPLHFVVHLVAAKPCRNECDSVDADADDCYHTRGVDSLNISTVMCLQVPHVAQLAKEALANTEKEQCVVIGLQSTGGSACS